MEVIKDIAAVIGCILSAISLITLCTKGGRTFIKNLFRRNTKDLHDENARQTSDIEEIKNSIKALLLKIEAEEEFTKQQCRNILKDIYYKYQKDKKIPLYQRKTADLTYDLYTNRYNGNSYATLLYKEICKWEIDTVSFQDLIED